jgi:hypothetical protein
MGTAAAWSGCGLARAGVLIIFNVAFCTKPAQAKQNEALRLREVA